MEFILRLNRAQLRFAAPETPAVDAAKRVEVRVDGTQRAFLARLVASEKGGSEWSHQLFFRPEDAEEGRIFGDGILIWHNAPTLVLTESMLHHKIWNSFQSGNLNRHWMPTGAPVHAIFRSGGSGITFDLASEYPTRNAAFGWGKRSPNEFLDWPEADFHEFCTQLFVDERSELRFALAWNSLSREEKDAVAFACDNGDWAEFTRLLAQVLLASGADESLANTSIRTVDGFLLWDFRDIVPPQSEAPGERFLARWQRLIFDVMRPAFLTEERHCVVQWRDYGWDSVGCSPSSAHERVEAQLRLRDWARKHIPESQIEALFEK